MKIYKAKRNFKIGDHERIRSVGNMVQEFGIDKYGQPDVKYGFIDQMHYIVGRDFYIEDINNKGEVYGHDFGFIISTDMIEHVEDMI
jgi:hypothetical protein